MDVRQPASSLEICVSQCPVEMLNTTADMQKFAQETGSMLCDYDVKVADYGSASRGLNGPCPAIVYGR